MSRAFQASILAFPDDIHTVFEEWRSRQALPDRIRLNNDRRRLITRALSDGHTAEDICLLIRYAYEGAGHWPGWVRGENPSGRTYLDLSNLLVIKDGRLSKRIDEARVFYAPSPEEQPDGQPSAEQVDPMQGFTPWSLEPPKAPPPPPQQSLLSMCGGE